MLELFEAMLWPILASVLLPPMLIYAGMHIVRREPIFINLAVAQVAGIGVCAAILLEHQGASQSFAWSAVLATAAAALFTFTRGRKPESSREPLVAVVYVVAAVISILLLTRSPEGPEQLKRILVGDLLLVNRTAIVRTFVLYLAIGAIHFLLRHKFEASDGAGGRRLWNFVSYSLYGLVVAGFVQIGGVLLSFAYLVIPAACSAFLAKHLAVRLGIGWVFASALSVFAIYLSYKIDLPTGATVVCVLGAAWLITATGAFLRRPQLVNSIE
jgi:zinc/manganese transport system permease protein